MCVYVEVKYEIVNKILQFDTYRVELEPAPPGVAVLPSFVSCSIFFFDVSNVFIILK